MNRTFPVVACIWLLQLPLQAGEPVTVDYTRTEDIIYGRKYGTALTLDMFAPKEKRNGAAVIVVVSGGWVSGHEGINVSFFQEYLRRGYTVFPVVHGSQPKFTIPEIMDDMHRAVRFIRFHARDYGVSPDRFGITGSSAGGHLSLMIGMSGKPGAPDAKDPIDRVSSRVQAVGCFFPPTDFMNYGREGRDVFEALREELKPFNGPFEFSELEKDTRRLVRINDEARRLEIAREVSPITHVSADDPPTLIFHGDADKLVPIQQAEVFLQRLEDAGVETRLVTRPGEGHGWKNLLDDVSIIADWFDRHLAGRPGTAPSPN